MYLCNKNKTGKGRTNGDKVSTFTVTTSQYPGNSAFCMVQEHSLHAYNLQKNTIVKFSHNIKSFMKTHLKYLVWNWVCCSWHGFTNSWFRYLTNFEPIKEEDCSFSFFLVVTARTRHPHNSHVFHFHCEVLRLVMDVRTLR